ncbi:hypothetical protein [Nocardioides speluncae]|uniref:hypothetical protein n=1 Tax=Nocardioides speluncae TaxID=2670337 RepID=UPI0012B17B6E|nr:hypothetical protein [Nocardioides speluncae]
MAASALMGATLPLVASLPTAVAHKQSPLECEIYAKEFTVELPRIPVYRLPSAGSAVVARKYRSNVVRSKWKCETDRGTWLCLQSCAGIPEEFVGRWVRRGHVSS